MHSIDKINLRIYLLVVWWWRPSGWQQLSLQPRAFRNDVPADVTSAESFGYIPPAAENPSLREIIPCLFPAWSLRTFLDVHYQTISSRPIALVFTTLPQYSFKILIGW